MGEKDHTSRATAPSEVSQIRRPAAGKRTHSERLVAGGRVARAAVGRVASGAGESLSRAQDTPSAPLTPEMQRSMGIALGTDLSSVRVHVGPESQAAATDLGARAFTQGQDIHFGPGEYNPTSKAGQHLIAHEVAHTVQQRGSTHSTQAKLEVSSPGDGFEREADAFADAFVAGRPGPIRLSSGPPALARKAAGAKPTGTKRDAGVAKKFRQLIRWSIPKNAHPKARKKAMWEKRRELNKWISRLPATDARSLALRIRPGGDLFAEFKYRLATAVRRQVRGILGSKAALPGADGRERTGIGKNVHGVGDDSTIYEKDAKGREDEYVPSGKLAVEVAPLHYRLWGYDVDSPLPRPEYDEALNEVAQHMLIDTAAYVYVTGHTSSSGSEGVNSKLGEERAYRILEELTQRKIDKNRIFVLGKEAREPLIKKPGNPAAMARNRRVELRVHLVTGGKTKKVKKKTGKPYRIPCDAAKFYANYYKALIVAWTLSLPKATGARDRGGDPRGAKPDRTHYYSAARGAGFTSEQAMKLYKNLPPLGHVPPPGPGDFARWRRDQEFYDNQLKSGACDPAAGFTPGVFMERSKAKEKEWPEPGDKAPGGQRY